MLTGAAMVAVVVVVVTCSMSTARLDSSDAGVVSFSKDARKSIITFCMPSGISPDQVLAQCCFMSVSFC